MPVKRPFSLTVTLILSLILSASWSEGSSEGPRIVDLRLWQGEEKVLLSAALQVDFDEEAREVLRGGVPLRFVYKIRLTGKGSIFGEKIIQDQDVIHRLEYDPVRKVYLFILEPPGSKTIERSTRDEEEALNWLTRIEDWPLYPLEKLEKRKRYRVRVMATLRSAELPSVLGYLFFFTTIFNRETPWVQLDFTY